MKRLLAALPILLAASLSLGQTMSQRAAVQVSATVQASPPRITLAWPTISGTTSLTIYRKLKTGTSWGNAIASPAASDLSWQDNSVTVGTVYEYRLVRVSNGATGTGYICTGIDVLPVDFRGKVVLLVDNTIASALNSELQQLEQDLRADGWGVLRNDVAPSATVSSVRGIIAGHYNADPANVKAVYIIGHVPVPYSGNQAPDGHDEHTGAWPCDGYYGEVNGTWSDNSVNNGGAQRPANRNIPGDGKFDQNNFPNEVELQVGRVDLFDLPAYSLPYVELMRNYLNKAHNYKLKSWTPQARGIMFDNLQFVSYPLAASGWRAMGPLVGPANITTAAQSATPFYMLVNNNSYLWTYASGGGGQETYDGVLTYHGAGNVGSIHNYAATNMNGVFNMSFGSYFGDWDNKNNFLRSALASGQALTNVWSSIPGWYFHHMGMGENIGYSAWATMNNTSLYAPLHDGWQGSIGKVHLGLMGDPTLRMKMVAPPQDLTVSNSAGAAAFSWTASIETGLAGYHVYEFASSGSITRLTTNPIAGTSYTNAAIPYIAGRQYMVRAVKLESGTSGSYYNLSLGAIGTAAGAPAPDCAGIVGGSALPGTPCNDNNPCTTNDAWSSGCQCAGVAPAAPVISSLSSNGPVCAGSTLTLSLSASGSGTLTYSWTGPNNFSASVQNPAITTVSAAAAGTYTVTVSNGCTSVQQSVNVAVSAAPSATITYGASPVCSTAGSIAVTRTGTAGGSYTAAPAGLSINSSTGAVAAGSSTGGTYTVTYTVAASGGCLAFSATAGITITEATSWYADADGDGAGNPGVTLQSCSQPNGYVAVSGDACPNDPLKTSPGNCGCGNLEPGSACDDGNANTSDDVIDGTCQCAGTPVNADCLGAPNGTALPGTPCNDNDAATGNDQWNANCECIGQVIDCLGTPGGSALPGTPCNDANPLTVNDAWNAQCFCLGEQVVFDCAGTPNGTAFIDACGQCAGGSTGLVPNPDADADGVIDCDDNCSSAFNPDQADSDGDGIGDLCDNCVFTFNPDQADANSDGSGDACEFSTSIGGTGAVVGLDVLPNPARNGMIRLRSRNFGARYLSMRSAAGTLVMESSWQELIDIDALAPGIYTIVAHDAEGRPLAHARFVKH